MNQYLSVFNMPTPYPTPAPQVCVKPEDYVLLLVVLLITTILIIFGRKK